MLRIAFLIVVGMAFAGCAASKAQTHISQAAILQTAAKPANFGPDQLAQIPVGRFCRVYSTSPDTFHEGTVARATADEIVLAEAVTMAPKPAGLIGELPFDWSRRLFRRSEVELPDCTTVPRGSIAAVDVYGEDDSRRLIEEQSHWRKEQKRLRQELTTGPEFPNEG